MNSRLEKKLPVKIEAVGESGNSRDSWGRGGSYLVSPFPVGSLDRPWRGMWHLSQLVLESGA